jgi:hypothetical protein
MTSPTSVSIKEIAFIAGLNPMTIRRNEKKWKLDSALVGSRGSKPRLYDLRKIRKILVREGYLEPVAPA